MWNVIDPRNGVRVVDERGTWIRRHVSQDRSYDRALNQSQLVRSHAHTREVTQDMNGSTVPDERSRAATRRIEFDEVLLHGDEQSELRESASGTTETADLTWGGEQLYVNVTKQVGKAVDKGLLG